MLRLLPLRRASGTLHPSERLARRGVRASRHSTVLRQAGRRACARLRRFSPRIRLPARSDDPGALTLAPPGMALVRRHAAGRLHGTAQDAGTGPDRYCLTESCRPGLMAPAVAWPPPDRTTVL